VSVGSWELVAAILGNLKLSFQDEISSSSSRGFCGVSRTQENVGQLVAANKRRLQPRNPYLASVSDRERPRGRKKQQGWEGSERWLLHEPPTSRSPSLTKVFLVHQICWDSLTCRKCDEVILEGWTPNGPTDIDLFTFPCCSRKFGAGDFKRDLMTLSGTSKPDHWTCTAN
jgi:hypothetical protein